MDCSGNSPLAIYRQAQAGLKYQVQDNAITIVGFSIPLLAAGETCPPPHIELHQGSKSSFRPQASSLSQPIGFADFTLNLPRGLCALIACWNLAVFPSYSVDHAASWKLIRPHFQAIFQDLVFPMMCYSNEDDQLWHSDPYEYIRLKFGKSSITIQCACFLSCWPVWPVCAVELIISQV